MASELIITLKRFSSTDQGTPGLLVGAGVILYSLELPDRNNQPQISRIPAGLYNCKMVKSPKFGRVYQVLDVPNRGNILLHSGNLAGDASLGFRTHSHGCILPCLKLGKFNNQLAGLMSGLAVKRLIEVLQKKPFQLEIIDA